MLIYLYNHHERWQILINENSIISRIVVKVLYLMSPSIITLLIYCLMLLLIFVAITKKYKIFGYFLALSIYQLGLVISIDILALKDISTFALCKIYHPIPYEMKLDYYLSELSATLDMYNQLSPAKDETAYQYIRVHVSLLLDPVLTKNLISNLTAESIHKLAFNQISEIYNPISVTIAPECHVTSRIGTSILAACFMTMGYIIINILALATNDSTTT